MSNDYLLSARSLTKSFGKCTALNDVSFAIDKPCIVGLIGNNGAGKTTLLKLLNGIYKPTSGAAQVNGANAETIEARRNCVFIDDTIGYPLHYKLKNILSEMPAYYERWDADKADKLMRHFRLPADRGYIRLSKGMRSIFNAIVALSANAPVTLLDEPISGMDAGARKDFYSIVLNEFMLNPRLIMVSSHLIGEMENIISHAVILKNSELIFAGDVNELTANAYRLQGSADDLKPLLQNAQVFETTKAFGKTQHAVMCDFTEKDFAYMSDRGIERQQLGLNDVCVYLCSGTRGKVDDIYANRAADIYGNAAKSE